MRPLNAVDMQWLLKSELSQINSGRAAVDVTTVQSFNSWPSPWFFPRLTAKSDLFIHNKRQHTTAFRKQTLKAQVFRLCARRKELWAGEKIPFPFLLPPPPPPPPPLLRLAFSLKRQSQYYRFPLFFSDYNGIRPNFSATLLKTTI